MVAAFHTWQSGWINASGTKQNFLPSKDIVGGAEKLGSELLGIAGNGYGAVVLFFVISGFVLSGSLARGPKTIWEATPRFLHARLFRIYPAVIVTIGIFAVLYWTTGATLASATDYEPLGLLRNILLLETSIVGVMWTLQLELIAVPLLLLVFFGWMRWGLIIPIITYLSLAALATSPAWNRAIGSPYLLGTIHAFIPGLIAFLIGARLVKRCSVSCVPAILIGLLVGFFVCRPLLGRSSAWSGFGESVIGALIVAFLAFGPVGGPGRAFDLPILRFFGRISFSFYLLHPLTLIVLWKIPETLGAVIRAGVPAIIVALALFLLSIAVVTPLAWIMYHYVERPGIAAGRSLAKHAGTWCRRIA